MAGVARRRIAGSGSATRGLARQEHGRLRMVTLGKASRVHRRSGTSSQVTARIGVASQAAIGAARSAIGAARFGTDWIGSAQHIEAGTAMRATSTSPHHA